MHARSMKTACRTIIRDGLHIWMETLTWDSCVSVIILRVAATARFALGCGVSGWFGAAGAGHMVPASGTSAAGAADEDEAEADAVAG
eukprot:6492177-Amphidinium_carterae.1